MPSVPNARAAAAPSWEHRRATLRVPVVLPARVSLRVVDAWIEVETCDLSPAGAGLFSVVEWPIGTPVTFACDVPGRTRPLPLLADGRVAWSEAIPEGTVLGRTGFRCGLEFERLPSRLEDAVTGALLRLETSAWR